MKTITIEVPDGTRAEWNKDGLLALVKNEEQDNRPVTERIKTFEDACREIGGTDNALVNQYLFVANGPEMDGTGKDLLAYLKLRIIAAALNEGWEPQFTEDEYRWYPWFYLYTEEELKEKSEQWKKEHALVLWGGHANNGAYCGLASAYSNNAFSDSSASFGARLAVKSEELAVYFGKQFSELWADFYVTTKR
jgi:hypothetical protein